MTEPARQKHFRGWIPVAILVMLLVYPLSFGPACWMARTGITWNYDRKLRLLNVIYSPVYWIYQRSPLIVQQQIQNYANLGVRHGTIALGDNDIYFFEDRAPPGKL